MGKYFPKEIIIELTNTCNFVCSFCYKNASAKGTFISEHIIGSLDKMIRGRVKKIMFTGGEPTIYPNFSQFVEQFSEYEQISMVTNGSELYKIERDVLKHFSMIQFSLYGSNDEEYRITTGIQDGFTRLQKSVEVVKTEGIPFTIAITISEKTMDRVDDYIMAAIRLGAKTLAIGVADPFGRGINTYLRNKEYNKKKDAFIKQLVTYKKKYQDKIVVILNNIHVEEHSDERMKKMVYSNCLKCGSGVDSWVVSQEGRVRPCVYLPEKEFDIGGLDALKQYIDGEFQKEKLCQAVREYYRVEQFMENGIIPCNAIQQYYEEFVQD